MTVIFASKVIQIGLPQELVPVHFVEDSCQTEQCQNGHTGENESVFGEKAFFGVNCFEGRPALSNELSIAVDEKVKHEAVDDWINFEVDGETQEEATPNVSAFED